MLLKRNLLETLALSCCAGTAVCFLLNYLTNISPISGVWFHLYVLFLFILSITGSFKLLKWLLSLNRPIKYDLEALVKNYPVLHGLVDFFPKTNRCEALDKKPNDYKEYDTNELSVISSVLERKLVSSWYVPYISEEIGFPFACKQILDQMIGKTFKICHKIDTKDVYIDVCSILIGHLKEYRKALKRFEKSPSTSIDTLYKKSHIIFDEKEKKSSGDHCTSILRIILKELVPWELWDTPHSELLVRILSKKLDSFIDSTITDPKWLNYKLITILIDKKPKGNDNPVSEIEIEDKTDSSLHQDVREIDKVNNDEETVNDSTKNNEIQIESAETVSPVVLPNSIVEEVNVNGNGIDVDAIENDEASEMVEQKSPVLRQRRGRQGKNEVKIYDRVIEGSVKTWETDMDLQCISLGQDLLASLDGEITLSRLWEHDAEPDGSPNPPRGKSPQLLWFGEEEAIDLDQTDSSPLKSPKKEISPKPAELLKELQTTVHQAKTKIGDLQDEAAGMMEGLLDFGIAGFKKGLRFTGLSDDTHQEKDRFFPQHKDHKERCSVEKHSPTSDLPLNKAFNDIDHKCENGNDITLPIQKEENGTSIPQLTKQQRVSSQDSVGLQGRTHPVPVPGDSPEPQYEEAEDLSTSIAKLRSLLQQRAQDNAGLASEDIWWQPAEETRGHTQRRRSSRPVDSAALADEYDMNAPDRNCEGQTSNNIQRLDKLFHRTVTGVFNSIRTAVGAEGEGAAPAGEGRAAQWTYVCTGVDQSVMGAVARLTSARRAAPVESALDSLAALSSLGQPAQFASCAAGLTHHDDDEEWAWWARGAALAEAAAAAALRSHVARRILAVLLLDLAEPLIASWLEDLATWLQEQIFSTFRKMSDEPRPDDAETTLREFSLEETCGMLLERIPAPLTLLGEDTLTESIRLIVSSFSHKEVNRDVVFRLLDMFALQFKMAAEHKSSSFEN